MTYHDDVIKWRYFPRYWPFMRGIHRPGEFPAQRPVTRMFSLICAWINGLVNNSKASDLRRYRAHYDVSVMYGGKHNEMHNMERVWGIYIEKRTMCFPRMASMMYQTRSKMNEITYNHS